METHTGVKIRTTERGVVGVRFGVVGLGVWGGSVGGGGVEW